ncbi:MAG TPA: hypothetical protein VE914_01990 [Candidatus Angelobacter sp.]|nr:hypothetical protein [Candidatus Angelobacter sp.]
MTDAEFLVSLESGTLPESEFNHAGHVRAAWLYLRRSPFPAALAKMVGTLRNYAAAHGKPDRYHETITVASLALINERLLLRGDGGDWRGFLEQNHELLERRLLTHYYRPETLASPAARRVFLLGEFRNPPCGA